MDADTGEVLKRGRLYRSPAENHSSPVLADGRLYIGSTSGELSVVAAGPEWEVLATNDLGEPIHATPVPADGRFFVRTASRLYAFGVDTR